MIRAAIWEQSVISRDPRIRQHIKDLWEQGETAEKISRLYGVSRNVIAGLTDRAGWKHGIKKSAAEIPQSLAHSNPDMPLFNSRIDRLNAQMDEVLKTTKVTRIKTPAKARA